MGRLSVKYQIDPSKLKLPEAPTVGSWTPPFPAGAQRGLFRENLKVSSLFNCKLDTQCSPGPRCTDGGNFRQDWNFPGPAVIWVIFGNQSNYFWTWWPKIDEIAPKYKGSPSPPQNKANRRWGSGGMFKPLFGLHNDQVPRFVGSPSKEMLKEKSVIRDAREAVNRWKQWGGLEESTRHHLFNWRPLWAYQDQLGHVSTA